MSLDSKYDEINHFYTLLNEFIKTHEASTTETKNRKNRILNNVNQLYNKYLDSYKKNCDSEKVKDEGKRGRDYKEFEIIDNGDQEEESIEERRKLRRQRSDDIAEKENMINPNTLSI